MKLKKFKDFLKESIDYENDIDVKSTWFLHPDFKSKKQTFIHDCLEYLSGYFGTNNPSYDRKKAYSIISKIFTHAMKSSGRGIDFLKDSGEHRKEIETLCSIYNTNDSDLVYDIIDVIFNCD